MRKRPHKKPEKVMEPEEIGVDGWPVNHDEHAEHERWVQARLANAQRSLELFEQAVIKHRYFPALMDALDVCNQQRLPLPAWAGREIWAILERLYSNPRNRKRFEAMTARRKKHLDRFYVVQDLLDRRDELNQTRDTVFDSAAEEFDGDDGVGEEAIRASYKKVRKAFRNGDAASFYVSQFGRRAAAGPRSGVKNRVKKP
jgi:hypothetical protein